MSKIYIMSKAKAKAHAMEEAKKYLRNTIEKGNRILIVQRSVSSSGMSRRLDVYLSGIKGELFITGRVAEAIGWPFNGSGMLVTGCGMDMHFHTADTLTNALYGKDKPKWLTGNGGGCIEWKSL